MLKKILATALAAAMIFGLASTALAAAVFPDISGSSNADVIAKLYALGLVRGDDQGRFNPTATINRAEFATMAVRMLGLETAAGFLNTPTVFADVTPAWSWAYGYVNIAVGRGLIQGYPDGTFRPGNPVTQAEALTMLLRALGYDDDLQGAWPTDYVMKGAELGVIESGFSGDVGATRALVATLVNNTLDQNPVTKNPDDPDDFDEEALSLYKDVFGLEAGDEVTLEGEVTAAVNTDDNEIEIDDEVYEYEDDVVVFGDYAIADLEGQTIEVLFNDDQNIIFVSVTTPSEVVGEITDIDTVDLTVTVGGTEYDVDSAAKIYKNGDLLVTTVSGALVEIQDADAKLLFNDDDEVYRIDASILDETGSLTAKKTATDADGDLVHSLQIGATWYEITSDTVLIRNGASAAFSDLEAGDDIEFSFKNVDELVYVDAFSQTVEGYEVTEWNEDADEVTITTKKDGVETTFVVNEDEATTVEAAITLGDEYDLTLNRAGEVIDVTAVVEEEFETGDVFTVASKDKYNDDGTVIYRVRFTDGTSVLLNDLLLDIDDDDDVWDDIVIEKNGVDAIAAGVNTMAEFYALTAADDLFRLEGDDVAGYEVYLYEETVTGWVIHVAAADNYEIRSAAGVTLALFDTDWQAVVTVNGVRVANTAVDAAVAPGANTLVGTVTLTGDDLDEGPEASAFEVGKFAVGVAYPVTAIASDDDGNYDFTLGNQGATLYVEADEDTVFMLDGEEVTAADVEIGHMLKADVEDALLNNTIAAYVSGAVDDEDPAIEDGSTAVYDRSDDELTVTFAVDETVKFGYVYVGGVKKTATLDAGTWTLVVDEDTEADVPAQVTIVAVDYAGNTSDAVTVTVTFQD